jgi:hypothetical protein
MKSSSAFWRNKYVADCGKSFQGFRYIERNLKSPFEKGGFRGISGAYKSPLTPFCKGGDKDFF